MTAKLKKGQDVNLKNEVSELKRILVGLGWDAKKSGSFCNEQEEFDVDVSVICMTENNEYESTVYFGRLIHPSGAIRHRGDSITGGFDGDNEQIIIDLNRVPSNITRFSININIYKAISREQTFKMINNCYVHVSDLETKKELVYYVIDGNFDSATGIFVADIYKDENKQWNFKAIGEGVKVSKIEDMVNIRCKREPKTSNHLEAWPTRMWY